MAAFNPTWTRGYDQFGRFCWYNKATGRVHHPSPLDSVDRCQEQQQQRRRRQGQGLSMAPDEDVGLLCDVAHPNVPTGSYFSLPATEVAERVEAGAFTQREKRGFAWDRGTRDETSTQPPTCRMYKPFADHNKPVALESTKPRRPQPAYKPSHRAWAKPVTETPVPHGRPGFDKSMPPPLPRPARGSPLVPARGQEDAGTTGVPGNAPPLPGGERSGEIAAPTGGRPLGRVSRVYLARARTGNGVLTFSGPAAVC